MPKRSELSLELVKAVAAFDGSYFTLAAISQTVRFRPKAKTTSFLHHQVAHSARGASQSGRSCFGMMELPAELCWVRGVGLGNEVTIDAAAETLTYAETV